MPRADLRIARPAALLLVILTIVACSRAGGGVPPSASPSIAPSAAPSGPPASGDPASADRALFRVTQDGGFVAPGAILGRLPVIVVYPDGRVIAQGPQIEIYPGPLMPNLQEHTLTAEALARLIALARDHDLLRTIHYDFPGIADATDTVLTIELDGATHKVSAYALAEGGVGGGAGVPVDGATMQGRAALRDFIDVLTGLPADAFMDQEHPYAADRIRIYAGKGIVAHDVQLPQPVIDWPLADLATAGQAVVDRAVDVRCQALTGDDLKTVLPLLQQANVLTTFRSGGQPYGLIVRPLLPGEPDC